ncbi:MAG: hypothetical protein ACXVP4_10340 [Bacteroidia bacterium]
METATMHTRAAIEIKAILEERMEGVYNKDIKKILSLYAAGAVTFDFKEPLKNKGTADIRERLEEWFSYYNTPISQQIKDLEIFAGTTYPLVPLNYRFHNYV